MGLNRTLRIYKYIWIVVTDMTQEWCNFILSFYQTQTRTSEVSLQEPLVDLLLRFFNFATFRSGFTKKLTLEIFTALRRDSTFSKLKENFSVFFSQQTFDSNNWSKVVLLEVVEFKASLDHYWTLDTIEISLPSKHYWGKRSNGWRYNSINLSFKF